MTSNNEKEWGTGCRIYFAFCRVFTIALIIGGIYLAFSLLEGCSNKVSKKNANRQYALEEISNLAEYYGSESVEDERITVSLYFEYNDISKKEAEKAFDKISTYLFEVEQQMKSTVNAVEKALKD